MRSHGKKHFRISYLWRVGADAPFFGSGVIPSIGNPAERLVGDPPNGGRGS
jgi:hypothetical protein